MQVDAVRNFGTGFLLCEGFVIRPNGRNDWKKQANYMCRKVCSSIVSVNRRGQIVETAVNPVERDEARFAGRRKYNRGRLLHQVSWYQVSSELSWYRAVFYLF